MENTVQLNGADVAHINAQVATYNAALDQVEITDSIDLDNAEILKLEAAIQLLKIERARKREVAKRRYVAEVGPQLKALGITAEDLKDFLTIAVEGKRTFRNPATGETWSGNESTKGPKPKFISDLIWQGGVKDFSRLDAIEVK